MKKEYKGFKHSKPKEIDEDLGNLVAGRVKKDLPENLKSKELKY